MNTSTYYNLKLVEGTDVVNPLTTDVPNYETIDAQMHNNSIAGVTLATEVANGKVHALIRENNECSVIRFIATSKWALGDTITVDGIPIVALLPNGESLPDNAYVINANVLCILTGTNLTVYVEGKKVENASEVKYNDTNVGAELVKLNTSVEQINSNLNELTTFSTAEKVIGKWIDNITNVYEKTYYTTTDGLLDGSITTENSTLIECSGSFYNNDYNQRLPINFYYNDNLRVWISINTAGININGSGGNTKYIVNVRYIKKKL